MKALNFLSALQNAGVESAQSQSKTLPKGLYTREDYPAARYYPDRSRITNSMLKKLDRSPLHLTHSLDEPDEDTAARAFGRALHAAVLEPDAYEAEFVVAPEVNKRTKAGKEEWTAFQEAAHAKGQTVLDPSQRDEIIAVRDAVLEHPAVANILSGGICEATVAWTDKYTGMPCKSRLDYFREKDGIIVDLKTTEDASYEKFSKSSGNWLYHQQAAMYSDGVEAVTGTLPAFVFVGVEKKPPYAVAVYVLDDAALQAGRDRYQKHLATAAECVREGEFPGYPAKVQNLMLPGWALKS